MELDMKKANISNVGPSNLKLLLKVRNLPIGILFGGAEFPELRCHAGYQVCVLGFRDF